MSKFTKLTSVALSCFVLVSALSSCNTDNNTTDVSDTSNNVSDISESVENVQTEQTEQTSQYSVENLSDKNSYSFDKLVIFDKEYKDIYAFFSEDGGRLNVISFQLAKYFLQGDKESLKPYYEKEEDWERDMERIYDTDQFKDLYYFEFDRNYITTQFDEQGRKEVTLSFNCIYGGYYNEDGEYVQSTDTYRYIYLTLVRTDDGKWLATSVGTD